MKLIDGTEVIDNSPNEKAGELAEAIFDDVVFLLDLEEKCIAENEDGTYNTELGQDLFNCIYEQCMNYFEKEDIKPQPKEPQYLYVYLADEGYHLSRLNPKESKYMEREQVVCIGKIKLEEEVR